MKIQQGRVSIKEGIVIGEGGGKSLKADIFLPPVEEKKQTSGFSLFTEEAGLKEIEASLEAMEYF